MRQRDKIHPILKRRDSALDRLGELYRKFRGRYSHFHGEPKPFVLGCNDRAYSWQNRPRQLDGYLLVFEFCVFRHWLSLRRLRKLSHHPAYNGWQITPRRHVEEGVIAEKQ